MVDQETIRTDVSTGALTDLVTFSLKVRREILSSEEAQTWIDRQVCEPVVNEKSGRAALAEHGLTTTTDEDRLVAAVRLVRPDARQTLPERAFEESTWKPAPIADWRRIWDEEVAGTDPWRTRELTLATGLLFPSGVGCRRAAVLSAGSGRRMADAGSDGFWTRSRPVASRRASA